MQSLVGRQTNLVDEDKLTMLGDREAVRDEAKQQDLQRLVGRGKRRGVETWLAVDARNSHRTDAVVRVPAIDR